MRKLFILCILSFSAAVLCPAFAKPVTSPADIPAYYANANGKSGTSLYKALNTITNVGFSSLGYDGAITAYQTTDVYPSDPSHPDYVPGRAGKLWDMYGACSFSAGNECGNYNGECDCYNREHSIPKSWWGGGKNNMYSDIFHLVPTDGYVNNRRSNYAFGEVQSATYTYNDCKLGSSVSTITTDKETLLGTSATCSGTVFEPRDEYKGDFARGYLGMIAKYSDTEYAITSGAGGMIFEAFKSTSHFGLTKYGIVLLMKWHREDPVSRKEIDRNNGIQATQGNRNPFIDYPYLAEYIWGEKNGQTVDMSKLMPSSDPDFIPGVSNGWRGEDVPPTPPTPTVKYGVSWSVCGTIQTTDSIAENAMISSLPAEPASCSAESPVFKGWTDTPISGTTDEEPAVLYRLAAQFPVVTEDVTYYAVFAKEIIVEGTSVPVTYMYSTTEQEGWTNTAIWTNNTYWLLKEGGEVVSPEVDLSGLSSISMKMRTYGGAGNPTITISAAGNAIASLTAENNKINEYSWTNTSMLSGKSPLTFTANKSNSQGVGFTEIVIDATGSGASYSYERFITDIQPGTNLEIVNRQSSNRKLLIDNQLYIMVGNQLYNLQGQRVK